MKLAAIDIGSNAIRMQVSNVFEYQGKLVFKKLEYIRFPLRLGRDVFTGGRIGEENKNKFIRLMEAFQLLIDLYEVDGAMACATSAMRESENGEDITRLVKEKHGLDILIIDGDREAELINTAINNYLDDSPHVHIDVGGGSTELNMYIGGEKTASHSFKMGSVRQLNEVASLNVWRDIEGWIKQHMQKKQGRITAIGTGGNINKIFELSGKKPGKPLSLNKIISIVDYLKLLSLDEKLYMLQLNPDRADVIVPAAEIYIHVMKACKASSIIVPDVGLKDGIMFYMYDQLRKKGIDNEIA